MIPEIELPTRRFRTAGLAGLASAVLAAGLTVIAGAMEPGYCHQTQYISELGALGARHGALVSHIGFLATGLLAAAFVLLGTGFVRGSRWTRIDWLLLLGIAIGYLFAAFFRCDAGCPPVGSSRQALHNLGGLFEYGFAILGLGLLAATAKGPVRTKLRAGSATAALLVALGFVLMTGDPANRGLWQRVAEAALFGWMVAVSGLMLRSPRRAGGEPSPKSESV